MSTVSTSPRATEDSVTPRRHSLTEGQKPGWTWMAVAAAAAVVAAGPVSYTHLTLPTNREV